MPISNEFVSNSEEERDLRDNGGLMSIMILLRKQPDTWRGDLGVGTT